LNARGLLVHSSRIAALFVLACALAACLPGQFLTVRRNVSELARSSALTGQVRHAEADAERIVSVAVRDMRPSSRVETFAHVIGHRFFALRVESEFSYEVVVFADRNGNLRPDADEPWGMTSAAVLAVRGSAVRVGEIALTETSAMPERLASALKELPALPPRDASLALGEITSLDDERFTPEAGHKGLWAPSDFLREVGTGIFFLAPYDPEKIPIVFVSGAGGAPGQWAPFVAQLDRTRYQPWMFLYPSGLRPGDRGGSPPWHADRAARDVGVRTVRRGGPQHGWSGGTRRRVEE
jgi:hypothetical protein